MSDTDTTTTPDDVDTSIPEVWSINADLLGYEFTDDEGWTLRVVGTWDVNGAYVLVHDGREELLRPAAVVRRRKQLDDAA